MLWSDNYLLRTISMLVIVKIIEWLILQNVMEGRNEKERGGEGRREGALVHNTRCV